MNIDRLVPKARPRDILLHMCAHALEVWNAPPICLLSNPESPPLAPVLQYFSELRAGTAPRLRLVYMSSGCSSFSEFTRVKPEISAAFRAAVVTGAGWVHRRMYSEATSWPWKLSQLINPMTSEGAKSGIATEFLDTPRQALDSHFSARFQAKVQRKNDLLVMPISIMIRRWSWSIRLSIAPVEFMHDRNQPRASADCTWSEFVCR